MFALMSCRVSLRLAVGVGCCLLAMYFLSGSAALAAPTTPSASGESLPTNPLVVPEEQALTGSDGAGEALEARLASPQAVAEREASRTEFSNLGSEQAVKADHEAFAALISEQAGGPPQLPAGQSIGGYLSDYAASVDLGGGQQALVESMAPMAVETSGGGHTPIDLGLAEAGGLFEPKTPVVAVRIPKRLGDGVTLSGTGVSLTPVDAQGDALDGSEGVLDGASVVYANVQSDTDAVVKPTTSGFEADTVLRSVASPSQLYFRVGLPAGASLKEATGNGPVEVVDEGMVIATILPPGAQDAAGTSVPVSMSLSGDMLALTVDVGSTEYQWPIEVDPEVKGEDVQLTTNGGKRTNWEFYTNNGKKEPSSNFASSEAGGVLKTYGVHEYKEGEAAAWVYQTRGVSKIYEFEGETEASNKEDRIESVIELQHEGGVTEEKELLSNETKGPVEYSRRPLPEPLCPKGKESCVSTSGNKENSVHFQQSVVNKPTSKFSFTDAIDSGTVYISEPEKTHSTTSENTTTPEFEFEVENGKHEKEKLRRTNALWGTGGSWLSEYHGAIQFIAKDTGIGVAKSILEYENASKKWEVVSGSEHSYLTENLCKGVQCPEKQEEYWTLNPHLPNGEDKIRYRAEEAFGQETHQTESLETEGVATVKVDDSKPRDVFISGLPYGNELSEKTYELTAYATDGEGSTVPSSGIESIELSVDGKSIKDVSEEVSGKNTEGTCSVSKGECTANAKYKIKGAELGAGQHAIVIVAKDNAGNEAREPETISIRHSTPVALGPGSLDLESGDFTLGAGDVSLGSGLAVSRIYSSRDLTVGVGGPLGPQWSLSTGSEESLVELVDHSVLVTSGNGDQTIFAAILNNSHEPTGKFETPPGDSSLELTSVENEKKEKTAYYLKDPAQGTSTKFELSSTPTVWVPTQQEGPAANNTVSYFYETVELGGKKVTRPSEERAATPAKVSCAPKMEPGCRALKFTYATKTKSEIGEGPSEWGEYEGRLVKVAYEGYSPALKKMLETPIPVAEYAYDKQGRLRAEWDPRISPALKTTYGYDSEGHVTVLTQPGQEPWVFAYGTAHGDSGLGRLMKATRIPTTVSAWSGELVTNTETPKVTGTPAVGNRMSVSSGAWGGNPVAYEYQWEDCNATTGGECTPIPGANSQNYTPVRSDTAYFLGVEVSATNGGGTTTVASSRTTVRVWGTPIPVLDLKYEVKHGDEKGQIEDPEGIAVENGHIWIAENGYETAGQRVQEFGDTEGKIELIREIGKFSGGIREGCGEKPQWLVKPDAITTYKGDIWVGDGMPGDCLKEFNEEGKELQEKSTTGGVGGVTVDAKGDLWYTLPDDEKGAMVEEYNPTTKTKMEGWGQYEYGGWWFGIRGIAVENGHVFVNSEKGVREFTEKGEEITGFGEKAGNSGWERAGGNSLALGPQGDVWAAARSSAVKGYSETGEFLTAFPESGREPWSATVDASGNFWLADEQNEGAGFTGFEEYAPGAKPTEGEKHAQQPGWTINYEVPVAGAGAPHDMSASEVAKWGQSAEEVPSEATAIIPPDSPQGWPASSYTRASVYYLDENGRVVNIASPSTGTYGAIATTEYNEYNDIVRTLSADDRATALAAGEQSAEVASLLSTFNTYRTKCSKESEFNEEREAEEPGTRLCAIEGPAHAVKYVSGKEQKEAPYAREHVRYFYDEKVPSEGPNKESFSKTTFALLTETRSLTEIVNAKGNVEEEVEPRTTVTAYAGQNNLGWKLREPTSVTSAAETGGAKVTHTTLYNEEGQVTEVRGPEGASGGSAHDEKTVYYGFEENKEYAACGKHPEWAGLVCESLLAKESETAGVPNQPITKTTYDIWNEPETVEETFPKSGSFTEHTRTTKDEYDAAGRMTSSDETSTASTETADIALPEVADQYSSTLGLLEKENTVVEGKTKTTISRTYNKLGQVEAYTDADGNVAKMKYAQPEGDSLLEEVSDNSDSGSSQKYTYNATTKQIEKLVDSSAGTFTASYDTEGRLLSEVYPNGMCANYASNAVGEATHVEYIKTSNCSEKESGVWFSEARTPSARGETFTRAATFGNEEYTYDTLGRLTEVHETPAGEYCKTRLYMYDEESNRTEMTAREPNGKKECATEGGGTEKHTYDEANRLTDMGTTYDALGNITKLSAADAEGHALESAFYVDNAVAIQTQNGVTNKYYLDPEERVRETVSSGKKLVNHYDGPGGAIAWLCEGAEAAEGCEATAKWTRNIPGIDGALAAVQNGAGTVGEVPVVQLHDLEGDVVAGIKDKVGETTLQFTYNDTEFGAPNAGKEPPKFAWLGADGVERTLASGVITDGATSYVPQTGRPLQSEEVAPPGAPDGTGGASANFEASPWNMEGIERVGLEAPGHEAGREREAFEEAVAECKRDGQCGVQESYGASATGASTTAESGGGATIARVKVLKHPACRTTTAHRNDEGVTGNVLVSFYIAIEFCWNNKIITSVGMAHAWGEAKYPGWEYMGLIGEPHSSGGKGNDYFKYWAQGNFCLHVPVYGCFQQWQPTFEVRVFQDGEYESEP